MRRSRPAREFASCARKVRLRGGRPRPVHRVELLNDPDNHKAVLPTWSLFITGPKVREWGFWCKQGWMPWTTYTGQDESGGRGARDASGTWLRGVVRHAPEG